MENTREALRHIRNGLLFMSLSITVNGFDLLPGFIGCYWMLKAVYELEEEAPRVKGLQKFGVALLVLSLIEWAQNAIYYQMSFLVGWEASLSSILSVLSPCLFVYFVYVLFSAAAEAAGKWGGSAETCGQLCIGRDVLLIAKIILLIFVSILSYYSPEDELVAAPGFTIALLLILLVMYFGGLIDCVLQCNALRRQIGAQAVPEQQAEE